MNHNKPDLIRSILWMLFAIAYLLVMFLLIYLMAEVFLFEKGLDLSSPKWKVLGAAVWTMIFSWLCFVNIKSIKAFFNKLWIRIKEFRSQSDINR